MPRIYDHCQYRDCPNIQSAEINLFRFPAKHDQRWEVWITNSGNGNYLRTWRPSSIRRAGICNAHFFPEAFWDRTRRRLRPKQNPIPYTAAVEEGEKAPKRMEDTSGIGGEEENFKKRIEENTATRMEEDSDLKMEEEDERVTCIEDERITCIGEEEIETEAVHEDEEDRTSTETFHNEEDLTSEEIFYNEEDQLRVRKEKVLKNYSSAADMDGFITVDEENDEMEWFKIEPPLPSTSSDNDEKCSPLSAQQKIANIQEGLANKYKKLRRGEEREKRKMARKIRSLQQQLKTERAEHRKKMAAVKRKKISIEHFLDARHCENPVSRAVVTLQLRKGKRRFTENEKDFAKRFSYYSSSAYRHMQQAGMKLPSLSTVRSWIDEYEMKPGFSDVSFDELKKKMDKYPPQQRTSGLKWDDLSGERYEEYTENPI